MPNEVVRSRPADLLPSSAAGAAPHSVHASGRAPGCELTAWELVSLPLRKGVPLGASLGALGLEVPVRTAVWLAAGQPGPAGLRRGAVDAAGRMAGLVGGVLGAACGAAVGTGLTVPAALVAVGVGLGRVRISVTADLPRPAALEAARARGRAVHWQTLDPSARWHARLARLDQVLPSAKATLSGIVHPMTLTPQAGPAGAELVDGAAPREQRAIAHLPHCCPQGVLQRFDVFTADHAQLDVAVLSRDAARAERRTLLVNVGNGERWEHYGLTMALCWLQRHDLQVVMYNGRGIGMSAGCEVDTADQVRDAEAVLRFATQRFTTVGAYGRSLGGASLFVGIDACIARGDFDKDRLAFAWSDFSFCNLTVTGACLAGARAGKGSLAHAALAGVVAGTGIDPLDAEASLRRRRLARQIVISSAATDPVIRGPASLHHADAGPNIVSRLRHDGGDHGDFAAVQPAFAAATAALFAGDGAALERAFRDYWPGHTDVGL